MMHSSSNNLVGQIDLAIFFTRHTWFDRIDHIELLRLSWSNQFELIIGSNNYEQVSQNY